MLRYNRTDTACTSRRTSIVLFVTALVTNLNKIISPSKAVNTSNETDLQEIFIYFEQKVIRLVRDDVSKPLVTEQWSTMFLKRFK